MRTSCCTFRRRQGRSGGVITSTELPAGSSLTVIWAGLSCSQCVTAQPEGWGGHSAWSAILAQFHCYVNH